MNEVQQAGVIAFQRDANELRFCVTFKPKSGAWGIPKGFVDPGSTVPETALSEAYEEAGLRGRLVGDPIGTYDYKKWGNTYRVAVYLMSVTSQDDDWEDKSFRERHWLAPSEAGERLRSHPAHGLFKHAVKLVNGDR